MSKKRVVFVGLILSAIFTASVSVYAGNNISKQNSARAKSAWAEAVRLAKERNRGLVCESEAYQSSIIEQLSIAASLSPYLKKQAAINKDLKKALVGNLMYFDVTGRMSSPADVENAIAQAKFYSIQGGVVGPSQTIQMSANNVVSLASLSSNEDGEIGYVIVQGTYAVDQSAGSIRIILDVAGEKTEYELEKSTDYPAYQLRTLGGEPIGYSNEPDDCSA